MKINYKDHEDKMTPMKMKTKSLGFKNKNISNEWRKPTVSTASGVIALAALLFSCSPSQDSERDAPIFVSYGHVPDKVLTTGTQRQL